VVNKASKLTGLIYRMSNRMEPHRIKHHPDVVLEVVLSTRNGNGLGTNSRNVGHTIASVQDSTIESLQVTQILAGTSSSHPTLPSASALLSQSSSSSIRTGSKARLSFKQVVQLAQKKFIESEVEQQMVSSLPFNLQAQVRDSANTHDALVQAIKDGQVVLPNEQLVACLQSLNHKMAENNALASRIMELVSENNNLAMKNNELTTCVFKLQGELGVKQDEMKGLQMQALNRLALIQNSVKALMTQTYELHEYPIPRLFIVLPKDSSSWDPLDLISNKFRLYFLCECGEHTKSTNSKIPHHIHVAKHEGYDITRPKEFFQQYGPYVLSILRMLKLGITVAGVAVPAISQLIRMDAIDQAAASLKDLTDTIGPGMDQAITYIEKASEDEGETVQELEGQMTNNEALEGADLRQLESFLKNKDANRVLGNLYRTVTTEGNVKWVCIDHYRENYHEKAAKAFRSALEALEGVFDENMGRVEVTLRSRTQAEQFYHTFEKARSVYELKLELDWEATQSDFKKLRDTLSMTNVGVLELHLKHQDIPARGILNRNQRYDPILDIMRHRSIQSVTLEGPQDLIRRSSLLSRNYEFPNLRHLDISLLQLKDDIPGVTSLVAKATNLSSLALRTDAERGDDGYVQQAYNAIAEHQTYPIHFTEWGLAIPPPPRESYQSMEWTEALFKFYRAGASRKLDIDELDESTVDALLKVTECGSAFTELVLTREGHLGDSFSNNISSIVGRSELDYINIFTREEEGRVRIFESIQWKHLRQLYIYLNPGTFETRVMRILVDGVAKMSEKVELDWFGFGGESLDTPVTLPEEDLLNAFVASTSIKTLCLRVDMTLEQILSLLKSTDFSRLESLVLCAEGFDSVKVDAILDGLQHATKLKGLELPGANITDEQKQRIRELKGPL